MISLNFLNIDFIYNTVKTCHENARINVGVSLSDGMSRTFLFSQIQIMFDKGKVHACLMKLN